MNLYNHTQTANRTFQVATCVAIGFAIAAPAHAAGSGMP
ncbi:MAG: conjugal transfer protein TrbC, partial [Hyphomonas sp. 32-62-5]